MARAAAACSHWHCTAACPGMRPTGGSGAGRPRVARPAYAHRMQVMGVVNVTPDSFSDGGLYLDVDAAVEHGRELLAEGAALLDVGGESTRPGADPVSLGEELQRVVPVIERLRGATVSVDTRKAAVAEAAVQAGARIVNDVSAFRHDPAMAGVVASSGAGCVLMHMLGGDPGTMQGEPAHQQVSR